MKSIATKQEMQKRAADALRAVLAEVSGTELREINHRSPDEGPAGAFTASVDVYGRRHVLACEIAPDDQQGHLRALIHELCNSIASTQADATPVIIASHISDEARALCRESQAGFIDLAGNARIALGEVFILKRTISQGAKRSATRETARPIVRNTAA